MNALGIALRLRFPPPRSFNVKCCKLREASNLEHVGLFGKHAQARCLGSLSPVQSSVRAVSQHENGSERKVYVDHTFYKTKTALSMKPLKPTFRLIDNGGAAVQKEGCIFLEFANSTGPRQYDWNNKGIFALSVGEIGTIISLQPGDSCEFYHDPSMGKSDQGKVRKSLRIESMAEKQGFFFNLTVANKGENREDRYNMPIAKSEYFVMRALFTYILPVLVGWNAAVSPSLVEGLMESPTPEGIVTTAAREWGR